MPCLCDLANPNCTADFQTTNSESLKSHQQNWCILNIQRCWNLNFVIPTENIRTAALPVHEEHISELHVYATYYKSTAHNFICNSHIHLQTTGVLLEMMTYHMSYITFCLLCRCDFWRLLWSLLHLCKHVINNAMHLATQRPVMWSQQRNMKNHFSTWRKTININTTCPTSTGPTTNQLLFSWLNIQFVSKVFKSCELSCMTTTSTSDLFTTMALYKSIYLLTYLLTYYYGTAKACWILWLQTHVNTSWAIHVC